MQDHTLSDGRDCVFNVLAAIVHITILNFITSSCSMSPIVMQGTPFPFPGPSIVNTFLRRTALFPNKELFTMRPQKLTRCIFKTNVPNKCRVDNKGNVYTHIYLKKEKHFKATYQQYIKKATIRMRIHPADIPLKSGEICQRVLLERENAE